MIQITIIIIINQKEHKMIRCKYCYRSGHKDFACPDKRQKRPPSTPTWVSNATCMKCIEDLNIEETFTITGRTVKVINFIPKELTEYVNQIRKSHTKRDSINCYSKEGTRIILYTIF